jgi:hypothetical protein
MSSPRVIASFLATAAAGALIASCGEQPLPTVATPIPSPLAAPSTGTAQLVDILIDPTAPASGPRAEAPIVYTPGTPPDPWPPGLPPKAEPGVPLPTDPTASPRMHIVIDPESVTHSGVAVPVAGCDNHPYTWYYAQVLVNDSGLAITFTERENFFDGRYTSTNLQPVSIRANGTVTLQTRWCSGYAKPHYAQTRFKGRDETGEPVVISAPWVRLLAP